MLPSSRTPQPSASVIILRDSDACGVELLMLQRHVNSSVLGGAYVFPGGKLDAADAQLDAAQHLDLSLAHMHATLAEPDTAPSPGAALYVAALRETFEECGVLFAHDATQQTVQAAAQRLANGEAFNSMLSALGLRLLCSAMHPWSRWITPQTSAAAVNPRRFDTRFFVAAMPAGQTARHDTHETTDSTWLNPQQALHQYWERQIELAPPQIMLLAQLARFASVAAVIDSARSNTPRLILPEALHHNGEFALCYPGDVAHSVAQAAMPGPTRFYFRNQRFEPEDGLNALLKPQA